MLASWTYMKGPGLVCTAKLECESNLSLCAIHKTFFGPDTPDHSELLHQISNSFHTRFFGPVVFLGLGVDLNLRVVAFCIHTNLLWHTRRALAEQ